MPLVTPQHPTYKEYAQQLAALSPHMAGPIIIEDEHARDETNPHRYEAVGHQLFRKLVEQPSEIINLHRAGIEHGFLVCARMAMWGAKAYCEQAQSSRNTRSVEDLSAILHRSYNTAVTPFSNINQDMNRVLEEYFNLTRNGYMRADIPFHIAKDTSGEFVLAPKPSHMELARNEIWRQYIPSSKDRCAAAGKMLMTVWAATIDTCASPDNSHLFAHDIANVQDSTSAFEASSV